ncbi:MAG: glycosyltransferase, partial [Spirochaetota bacterium]
MISVCIATFNGEKYIHEQLVSILQQLGTNDEIIISDDSSTDNTIKMIHAINDKRIKIYHNNVRNPIQNFENALRKAQGKYIFLSDQDDIWLETKISITIEHLQKYDLVVHDA